MVSYIYIIYAVEMLGGIVLVSCNNLIYTRNKKMNFVYFLYEIVRLSLNSALN